MENCSNFPFSDGSIKISGGYKNHIKLTFYSLVQTAAIFLIRVICARRQYFKKGKLDGGFETHFQISGVSTRNGKSSWLI